MNIEDILFSESHYLTPPGTVGVEYVTPDEPYEQPGLDSSSAKTAILPMRLTIPDAPFSMPEQELEVTVLGNLSKARTLPKSQWPLVSFEILTDEAGGAVFRSLAVAPAGGGVAGSLLFSRYNYFLCKARRMSIAFPTIGKEFEVSFTLSETALKQGLCSAAVARKLKYIESQTGRTLELPEQFTRADLLAIELIYRGMTEGEFAINSDQISLLWQPVAADLNKPPFTEAGTFSTTVGNEKIDLFGQSLKVGRIGLELKNVELINREVLDEVRERPSRPVRLEFKLLDGRALFSFEKYMKELARDRRTIERRMASLKENLSKRYSEPDELVNAIHMPLVGTPSAQGQSLEGFGRKVPVEVTSKVEAALSQAITVKTVIPDLHGICAYMLEHDALAEPLAKVCQATREELGEEAGFSLEIYQDAETNDRYLTLYVRQDDGELPARMRALQPRLDADGRGGWLVLAPDFRMHGDGANNNIDGREQLELARFLRYGDGERPPQASLRSVADRAYFAALLSVCDYEREQHGFQPAGSAQDHAALREHLIGRGAAHLAAHLDRLRQWRALCDYRGADDLERLADAALEEAEAVIAQLDN